MMLGILQDPGSKQCCFEAAARMMMLSIRSSAAVLLTIWGACSKRNATCRIFGRKAGANIAKLLWHKVSYEIQTLAIAEQKFAPLDI